jgi:hypothetical protein
VDPVGADHEVVTPVGAVAERHVDVVGPVVERVDREAEPYVRAGGLHRVREDRVQARSGDAVHRRVLRAGDPVERQVGEQRAVGKVEARALHREALRDDLVGEPERVERAQGVAGLDDPDAVHRPRGVDLGDVDLHPGAAQRERRRQASYPASDDERPADLSRH